MLEDQIIGSKNKKSKKSVRSKLGIGKTEDKQSVLNRIKKVRESPKLIAKTRSNLQMITSKLQEASDFSGNYLCITVPDLIISCSTTNGEIDRSKPILVFKDEVLHYQNSVKTWADFTVGVTKLSLTISHPNLFRGCFILILDVNRLNEKIEKISKCLSEYSTKLENTAKPCFFLEITKHLAKTNIRAPETEKHDLEMSQERELLKFKIMHIAKEITGKLREVTGIDSVLSYGENKFLAGLYNGFAALPIMSTVLTNIRSPWNELKLNFQHLPLTLLKSIGPLRSKTLEEMFDIRNISHLMDPDIQLDLLIIYGQNSGFFGRLLNAAYANDQVFLIL